MNLRTTISFVFLLFPSVLFYFFLSQRIVLLKIKSAHHQRLKMPSANYNAFFFFFFWIDGNDWIWKKKKKYSTGLILIYCPLTRPHIHRRAIFFCFRFDMINMNKTTNLYMKPMCTGKRNLNKKKLKNKTVNL